MALTAYAVADHADTMADAEHAPAMAPPVRTDEQILPRIRWVPIGKSNCYLNEEKSQPSPIYKIAVDILKQTNFFRAFTASSTIPAIYIQQFWDTICFDSKAGSYKCQLDEQWFDLTKDTLRDALQITPVDNNRAFSPPPTPDTLVEFVNKLGYPKEVIHLSNVTTNDMFQPWRALTTIINLCLTGKTSGFERPRAPVLQILWGVVNRAHIDYAERMWEEFTQSIHTFTEDKRNLAQHTLGKKKATLILIPSIRFTKLIIFHLQRLHNFHPRPESPLHLPTEEPVLGNLKFSAKGTKREVFGMTIPNELINDVIRGSDYYDAYLEKVAKHQRHLAGEEVSDPESPAPKPAKPTKQAKPKATKQPTVSKTTAKKPKPAPAKPQEKKRLFGHGEETKKKKRKQDSPKTPPGSPPLTPHSVQPQLGASGASDNKPPILTQAPHQPPSSSSIFRDVTSKSIDGPKFLKGQLLQTVIISYSQYYEAELVETLTKIDCFYGNLLGPYRHLICSLHLVVNRSYYIQSDFFFNKDLEYLRIRRKIGRPALSISKMKALSSRCRLEQLVPDQFWIELEGAKFSSERRQRAVRTHMRIPVSIESKSSHVWYNYMKKMEILLDAIIKQSYWIKVWWKWRYLIPVESIHSPMLTLNVFNQRHHDNRKTYNTASATLISNVMIKKSVSMQVLGRFQGANLGSKMGDIEINTLMIEQYLALTRGNQAPGVVKPEIGNNVKFEIKSRFIRELREDTFFDNKNDDAHEHAERVLDIFSNFSIPGISHDAIMLRVFFITSLELPRDGLKGYLQD
ncbi:hypothetical protein Tco_1403595 [Tanacetum coccineum]